MDSNTRAVYVDGIGWLDEYGSYLHTIYSKGVIYFLRDYYFREIERQLEIGTRASELRPLIKRLNDLNSNIRVYEQYGKRPGTRQHQLGRRVRVEPVDAG